QEESGTESDTESDEEFEVEELEEKLFAYLEIENESSESPSEEDGFKTSVQDGGFLEDDLERISIEETFSNADGPGALWILGR
ncbi:5835_t:CDS:1, partial [Diversispora eburnea]